VGDRRPPLTLAWFGLDRRVVGVDEVWLGTFGYFLDVMSPGDEKNYVVVKYSEAIGGTQMAIWRDLRDRGNMIARARPGTPVGRVPNRCPGSRIEVDEV